MDEGDSKPLKKADTKSVDLLIRVLEGRKNFGLNIDRVCVNKLGGLCIVEFQECDTVEPWESSPKRYWDRAKRKFLRIGAIAHALNAKFYVVSWSADERWKDQFTVGRFRHINFNFCDIEEKKMNLDEFREWFLGMNNNHPLPDDLDLFFVY